MRPIIDGSTIAVFSRNGLLMLAQNRRWMTSSLALIVLASILAMSACSGFRSDTAAPFDTLRVTIDEEVPDKARLKSMTKLTSEMESVMNELFENIAGQRQVLDTLITDYNSSESDFLLLFADSLEKRESLGEQYLTLRLELKQTATAEEWQKIGKAEYESVAQAALLTIYPSSDK
jgi:hypothetical protein